jgi:hypothetical protein
MHFDATFLRATQTGFRGHEEGRQLLQDFRARFSIMRPLWLALPDLQPRFMRSNNPEAELIG